MAIDRDALPYGRTRVRWGRGLALCACIECVVACLSPDRSGDDVSTTIVSYIAWATKGARVRVCA